MKILLFTDMPPCENYTAGIVLHKLCKFLIEDGHKICCYYVKADGIDPLINTDLTSSIVFSSDNMPIEDWGHKKYGPISSFLMNNFSAIFIFPVITKKIIKFALKNNVQMIWGVIQGHMTIRVLRRLTALTRLPYVVQAWDPSEWWLNEYKFDAISKFLIMRSYSFLLKKSNTFIASSWAMSKAYSKKYNVRSVPVLPGIDEGQIIKKISDSKLFTISFAGQMYASEEIICFLNAVEQVICDIQIKIIIYGKDTQLDLSKFPFVETKGWLNQEELIYELSAADLLYCPYRFDKSFKKIAMFSFPSKLTCYLKSGIPVLFHGPDYSSPGDFLKKYNAGYIFNSLNVQKLAAFLKFIINDSNRNIIANNGYIAFNENLTMTIMKRNFFDALNL